MSGGGKVLWVDYLSRHVVAAAASPLFGAVSCDDGQLHVYSQTGRRSVFRSLELQHLTIAAGSSLR